MCVVPFYSVVLPLPPPNRLFRFRPQIRQVHNPWMDNWLEILRQLLPRNHYPHYPSPIRLLFCWIRDQVAPNFQMAGSGGCQLSVEAGSVLSDSLSVSHSSPNRSSISTCVGASHSGSLSRSVASLESAWLYSKVFKPPSRMKWNVCHRMD